MKFLLTVLLSAGLFSSCRNSGPADKNAPADDAPLEIRATTEKLRVKKIQESGYVEANYDQHDFISIKYEIVGKKNIDLKQWNCYYKNWSVDNPGAMLRRYPCNYDSLSDLPIRKGGSFSNSVAVVVKNSWTEPTIEFRICFKPVDPSMQPGAVAFSTLGEFCSNPIKLDVIQ